MSYEVCLENLVGLLQGLACQVGGGLIHMKGANKEIELFTKSDKTKERPYALNLFFVLFVAISAFTATIAFRPIDQLPEKPLNEDGYYALTVARNLADGHWFSYDGTNKSNGFQPLFTAICAIPHLLAGNNAL